MTAKELIDFLKALDPNTEIAGTNKEVIIGIGLTTKDDEYYD
jgi:hypothetical protein